MTFESLSLSSSDILFLENQNINGNHCGNSVLLLAAFSTNSGKSWDVGAVLFQTISEVAIIKVTISKEVSNYVQIEHFKLSVMFFISFNISLQ